MSPDQLSSELRLIAAGLEGPGSPSLSGLILELRRVVRRVSTDRSLAEAIREAILPQILALFPSGTFEDKLYDTHEAGKGFRPGYVSFAIKPTSWSGRGLVGGILVRGTYSPKVLRSTAPEPGTPEHKEWVKAGGHPGLKGGEVETLDLAAGYYNKMKGGSLDRVEDLGGALVEVGKTEEVTRLELADPASAKAGIDRIVESVLQDPPEGALSEASPLSARWSCRPASSGRS